MSRGIALGVANMELEAATKRVQDLQAHIAQLTALLASALKRQEMALAQRDHIWETYFQDIQETPG